MPFASDRAIGAIGFATRVGGADLSVGYRADTGGGQLRQAVDIGVRFD